MIQTNGVRLTHATTEIVNVNARLATLAESTRRLADRLERVTAESWLTAPTPIDPRIDQVYAEELRKRLETSLADLRETSALLRMATRLSWNAACRRQRVNA